MSNKLDTVLSIDDLIDMSEYFANDKNDNNSDDTMKYIHYLIDNYDGSNEEINNNLGKLLWINNNKYAIIIYNDGTLEKIKDFAKSRYFLKIYVSKYIQYLDHNWHRFFFPKIISNIDDKEAFLELILEFPENALSTREFHTFVAKNGDVKMMDNLRNRQILLHHDVKDYVNRHNHNFAHNSGHGRYKSYDRHPRLMISDSKLFDDIISTQMSQIHLETRNPYFCDERNKYTTEYLNELVKIGGIYNILEILNDKTKLDQNFKINDTVFKILMNYNQYKLISNLLEFADFSQVSFDTFIDNILNNTYRDRYGFDSHYCRYKYQYYYDDDEYNDILKIYKFFVEDMKCETNNNLLQLPPKKKMNFFGN
jgi:hypothetical protein